MGLVVKRLNSIRGKVGELSNTQRSSRIYFKVFNGGTANLTDCVTDSFFEKAKTTGFWVMNSEPVTYTVQVSWGANGGASIAQKIDELFNSTLFKLMAGTHTFSAVPSDSWTQQVAKEGHPMSINVKFRAYARDIKTSNGGPTCSANFIDLIRFFTRLTSAPKVYSLGTNIIEPIKGVWKNGEEMADFVAGKFMDESDNATISEKLKATVSHIGQQFGFAEPSDHNTAVRAQYTLQVSLSDHFGHNDLDWIVTNFTATPSQQIVFDDTIMKDTPLPMWVDFDVTLETNIAPSNAYLSKFFTK